MVVGLNQTCAILVGGKLNCWGENNYGQLDVNEENDTFEVSAGD